MALYDNDQAEIDAMPAVSASGMNAISNINADNTSSDLNNNIGGLRSAINTLSHNVAQFAKTSVSMAKEVAASATKDLNVDKQGFLMRNAATMGGPFGAILSKAITDSGVGDRIGGYVKDGVGRGINSIGNTVKSMFGGGGGFGRNRYDSQSGYMNPAMMTKSVTIGNGAVVKELHQGIGAQLIQANKYAQDELNQTKYGHDRIVTAIKDLDDSLQGKQNGRTGAKPQSAAQSLAKAAPTIINNYYGGSTTTNNGAASVPNVTVDNDSVVAAINALNQNFTDNANKTGKLGFIGEILGGTRLGSLFKGKYTTDIQKSNNPLETLVSASLQIYRWQRLYGELQKKQLNELIKLSGGEEKDVVGEHGLLKEAWYKQNSKMKKALGPLGGLVGDLLFFDQNKFDDMNRAQAAGALQQVIEKPSKEKGFKGLKENFKDWWGKSGDRMMGTQGMEYDQILELQQRLAAKFNTFEKLREFHEDTNELGTLKEKRDSAEALWEKINTGKGGWFGTGFRAAKRGEDWYKQNEEVEKNASKLIMLQQQYDQKYRNPSGPQNIFDKLSDYASDLTGVVKGSLPVTIVKSLINSDEEGVIPMAKGGIINKPIRGKASDGTPVMIGEKGREAVIPLESKDSIFSVISKDIKDIKTGVYGNNKSLSQIAKAEMDENKEHAADDERAKKAAIWEKAKGPKKEGKGFGKTLKGIGSFLLKNPWLIGIAGMLMIPGAGKWMMSSVANFAKGFTMIKKVGPFLSVVPKFISGFSKVFPAIGKALTGVNKFGHVGKLLKIGTKMGGKTAMKTVFKIPVLGSILQILFAINRFKKGDTWGGIIEVASGIASCFPGLGTGISLALDALNIARDLSKDSKKEEKKKETKKPQPVAKKVKEVKSEDSSDSKEEFENRFAKGGIVKKFGSGGHYATKTTNSVDGAGNPIQYGEAGTEAIMPLKAKPGNLLYNVAAETKRILSGKGPSGPVSMGNGKGGGSVHAGDTASKPMTRMMAVELAKAIGGPGKFSKGGILSNINKRNNKNYSLEEIANIPFLEANKHLGVTEEEYSSLSAEYSKNRLQKYLPAEYKGSTIIAPASMLFNANDEVGTELHSDKKSKNTSISKTAEEQLFYLKTKDGKIIPLSDTPIKDPITKKVIKPVIPESLKEFASLFKNTFGIRQGIIEKNGKDDFVRQAIQKNSAKRTFDNGYITEAFGGKAIQGGYNSEELSAARKMQEFEDLMWFSASRKGVKDKALLAGIVAGHDKKKWARSAYDTMSREDQLTLPDEIQKEHQLGKYAPKYFAKGGFTSHSQVIKQYGKELGKYHGSSSIRSNWNDVSRNISKYLHSHKDIQASDYNGLKLLANTAYYGAYNYAKSTKINNPTEIIDYDDDFIKNFESGNVKIGKKKTIEPVTSKANKAEPAKAQKKPGFWSRLFKGNAGYAPSVVGAVPMMEHSPSKAQKKKVVAAQKAAFEARFTGGPGKPLTYAGPISTPKYNNKIDQKINDDNQNKTLSYSVTTWVGGAEVTKRHSFSTKGKFYDPIVSTSIVSVGGAEIMMRKHLSGKVSRRSSVVRIEGDDPDVWTSYDGKNGHSTTGIEPVTSKAKKINLKKAAKKKSNPWYKEDGKAQFKKGASQLGNWAYDASGLPILGGVLGGAGKGLVDTVKYLGLGIGQSAGGILKGVGQAAWGGISGVGHVGLGIGKGLGQAGIGLAKGTWSGISGIGGGLWSILQGRGDEGIKKMIKGLGGVVTNIFKGLGKGTMSILTGLGKGVWSLTKGIAKGLGSAAMGVVKGTWSLAKAAVALPWNVAKGAVKGAWKTGKAIVTAPWQIAKGVGNMAVGAAKWMFGKNKPQSVVGAAGAGGKGGAGSSYEDEPRGTYADIFRTCIKYGKQKKSSKDLRKYLCNAFAKHPTLKKDRTARDYVARKALQYFRANQGKISIPENNKLYSDLYWGRFGNTDSDKSKNLPKGSSGSAGSGAGKGIGSENDNKKNGYKFPWLKLAAHTGLIDHNAKNLYKWASPHVAKAAKWVRGTKLASYARVYAGGVKNLGFKRATKAAARGIAKRITKSPLVQKALASAPVKAATSAARKVASYAKVYKNGVKNLGFTKATKAAAKGLGKRALKSAQRGIGAIAHSKVATNLLSDARKVGSKMWTTFKNKGVVKSLKAGYKEVGKSKTVKSINRAIKNAKKARVVTAVKGKLAPIASTIASKTANLTKGVNKAFKNKGVLAAANTLRKNVGKAVAKTGVAKTLAKSWKTFRKKGIYQGGKVIVDSVKKAAPKVLQNARTALTTVKNNKYVQKALQSKAGQSAIKAGKSVVGTAVKYGKDIGKVARIGYRAAKTGGLKAGLSALKNAGKHSATFRRAVGGVRALKAGATKVFATPQLKALARAGKEAVGAGKAAYKVFKSGKGIKAAAQMGIKSLKGSKVIGGTIKGAKAMFQTGVNAVKSNKYVQKAVNSKVGQAVIKGGKKAIAGAKALGNLVKSKGVVGAAKAGIQAVKNSKMIAEAGKVARIAKRAAKGKGLIKGTVAATKAAINAAKHTKTIRTVASGLSKAKNVVGNTKVVKGAVRAFKDARGVGKAMIGAVKSGKGIKGALKMGKAAIKGTKTLKNIKSGVSAAKTGFTLAKTVMKGGIKSLMSGGLKAGLKAGVKGVAKGGLKGLAKKIPILGTVLSLFFAFQRFKKGEWGRGIIELLSGVASLIPGVGTGISIVLDLLNMFLDKKMADKATGAEGVKEKPKQEKKEKKGPKWMKRFANLFNKAKDHWSKGNYIRAIGYGVAALAAGNPITGGITGWFLKKLGIDVDGEESEDKPKGSDKKPQPAAEAAKKAAKKSGLNPKTEAAAKGEQYDPANDAPIQQVAVNNMPTVKANLKRADELRAENEVNKQKKANSEIGEKLDTNTGKMINSNTNNVTKMSRNMSQVINNNSGNSDPTEPFRIFTKSNNEISMV